jgi:hypothetical protein
MDFHWKQILPVAKALIIKMGIYSTHVDVINALVK